MKEIWKDVVGYEGLYKVSNLGNVYSCVKKSKRNLKLSLSSDGYYRVSLWKDGKAKQAKVHRLIAKAFLDFDKEKVINHIDGIRTNNILENLELVSQKENVIHSWHVLNKHKIKKVLMLSLNDFEIIGEFEDVKDAEEKTGVNQWNIRKCCHYRGFTAGNFHWIYKDEYEEFGTSKMIKKDKRKKMI